MARPTPSNLTILVALSLLPMPLATLPAQADNLREVTGTVDAVTVYPDRAMVRRVVALDLPAGMHTIRFKQLTKDLYSDSVRVGGDGTAGAIVHGFDLRTAYLGESPTKEVRALENKLLSLSDQERALKDESAIHQRQYDTLVETSEKAPGGLASQLGQGKANVKTWSELLGYLQAQQNKELQAVQAIDRKKRGITNQIAATKAELNKLRGFRRQEVYQVDVKLETTRAGSVNLELEYVLSDASWSPAYDARLDAKGEKLDWRYYGVVRQSTGENWLNVALRLSTARPASGSQPPMVNPWFLSLYQPQRVLSKPVAGAFGRQNVFNQRPARPGEADEMMAEAPAPPIPVVEPVAVVTNQGSSVTLEVPGRTTIPSDNEPHQTPIGHALLKPRTAYRTVPRVSTEAFLEVEVPHTGPWPMLAGPVKAFVGKDYVGTSPLREDIVPGQKFNLPMGVDRSIQVKRTRLKKEVGESGLLGKRGFAEYRYEVAITNFKGAPQPLTIIESIPQVTDQSISVALTQANAAPEANSPPGQVRWKFKVQPGEKKTLNWGYRVEWEPDQKPSGLE